VINKFYHEENLSIQSSRKGGNPGRET